MRCVCGEVELGVAGADATMPTAELGGVLHRADGPCHDIQGNRPFGKHAEDCVCMECEDRRAGRDPGEELTLEATSFDTFGRELLEVLELGPYTRKIELEAQGPNLTLMTVTTSAYVEMTEDAGRWLIDHLRLYKLVPITLVEPTEL